MKNFILSLAICFVTGLQHAVAGPAPLTPASGLQAPGAGAVDAGRSGSGAELRDESSFTLKKSDIQIDTSSSHQQSSNIIHSPVILPQVSAGSGVGPAGGQQGGMAGTTQSATQTPGSSAGSGVGPAGGQQGGMAGITQSATQTPLPASTFFQSQRVGYSPLTPDGKSKVPVPGVTSPYTFVGRPTDYPLEVMYGPPPSDPNEGNMLGKTICETSGGSPPVADMEIAMAELSKKGGAPCEQSKNDGSDCSPLVVHNGWSITSCAMQGVKSPCDWDGWAAKQIVMHCSELIDGKKVAGGQFKYFNLDNRRTQLQKA